MKVLFDTNVYISYLLSPDRKGTIAAIVELAIEHLDLVVPPPLLEELRQTREKSRLRERISVAQMEQLVAILMMRGEAPTLSPHEIQAVSRDAQDDYLIAYGLIAEANYLVTGDKDLTVLGNVASLRIVTPAQFHATLSQEGYL